MVDWYKHDIPDWMDATENLDDASYRVFHVIVQLIMQNEGPIRNNEQGIAGRCRQSRRTYRRVLKELCGGGYLTVESGRIANNRASIELKKIDESRLRSGKGGKARAKSLKDNEAAQVPLQKNHAEKTRLEKTRYSDAAASGANAPSDPRTRLFNEGLKMLAKITGKGPDACRSFVGKCLKAAGDDAIVVLGLIEDAARNQTANPSAWIAARLKSMEVPNGKAQRTGSVIDAWDRLIEKAAGNDRDAGEDAVVIVPPRPIQRS